MAYLVNITVRAERDLAHLYGEVNAEHSDAALKWYWALKEAVLSLEERPNRCPLIHKRKKLRHVLYGRKPHIYRVIYRVLENQKEVEVLHIRHGDRLVAEANERFIKSGIAVEDVYGTLER